MTKQKNKKHITDYHDFTSIGTPKDIRNKLDVGDIWINAVVCLVCGDYVRSRNRHDFRWCSCGAIAVDGGSWYTKRVGESVGYGKQTYINIIIPFNLN